MLVSHTIVFPISDSAQTCAENSINNQSTETPPSKVLPNNKISTDFPVPQFVHWVSLQPYQLLFGYELSNTLSDKSHLTHELFPL